jgi:mRNA interferase MazF
MSEVYRRGDIVLTILSGDYGKPRPAVVVQSDLFNETHASFVLCPISSEITGLTAFRVYLPASEATGLRVESEIMVDKMTAARRERIRQRIGSVPRERLAVVDRALRVWLSLGPPTGSNL